MARIVVMSDRGEELAGWSVGPKPWGDLTVEDLECSDNQNLLCCDIAEIINEHERG